jgi:hypothetical protein
MKHRGEVTKSIGFRGFSDSIRSTPQVVYSLATWWLVPVSEHLVQGPVPLSDKSIGKLLCPFSRRCSASPHCGLRGLILSVVRDKLT